MSILKLGVGRDMAISGTVTAVEEAPGKFGAQYKFTLDGNDDLYCAKDATDRQVQFQKLGSVDDYIGKAVTFWKKPQPADPSKGYLNIELGGGRSPNTTTMASAALGDDYAGRQLRNAGHIAAAPKKSWDDIKDTYVATLGEAVSIADDFAAFNDGNRLTEQGILSVAATLFIERNRAGV